MFCFPFYTIILSYESLTNGYVVAALLMNVLKRIQNGFAKWHILRTKIKGGDLLLDNPFEWSKWQTFNL
jgi:hypothetical protein